MSIPVRNTQSPTPSNQPNPPVFGSIKGDETLRTNIFVAKVMVEIISPNLGPAGTDKMITDQYGTYNITQDGLTILQKIDVQHPVAKLMKEAAQAQHHEVGDGGTSVVLLTGSLLAEAEKLIALGIHPATIMKGFHIAASRAILLLDEFSKQVNFDDRNTMLNLADTAVGNRIVGFQRKQFAKLALDAVNSVMDKQNGTLTASKDHIQIISRGGVMLDTQLFNGVVVEKGVVHREMPRKIENARVTLICYDLTLNKPKYDLHLRIAPDELGELREEKNRLFHRWVERIRDLGTNVLVCERGIDDVIQGMLTRAGIMALRRVNRPTIENLARASGARIVFRVEDLEEDCIGHFDRVEEQTIKVKGDLTDRMVIFEQLQPAKSVSVVIRATVDRALSEAGRAFDDAISVLLDVAKSPYTVLGGGAIELQLSRGLRDFARSVDGKERLAVDAFAKALEVIPRSLAENNGQNAMETLMTLRSCHKRLKGCTLGVNAFKREISDMEQDDIMEPTLVKRNAIKAAAETAITVLSIDDYIFIKKPIVPKDVYKPTKDSEIPRPGETPVIKGLPD